MKLLSISIAAYNVESFIKNTLESLIIDDINKLEVIIENDGSKDDTANIAQKYVNKYPTVFKLINKENGGYGSTINQSILIATGKYFKQLDGDDWFETTNLENLINLLEEITIDCIYTPYYEVYEHNNEKKLITLNSIEFNKVYCIEELAEQFGNDIFKMHSLTFNTQYLKNLNYKILEHCFYTDQEYVVYSIMHLDNIYISNIPIYCYRLGLGEQSVSISGMRKHYKDHEKVIKQLLSHFEEMEQCRTNLKSFLMSNLFRLIATQFTFYLVLPTKLKVKKELIEFNNFVKSNYPSLYNHPSTCNCRNLKILRATNFLLYFPLAILLKLKYTLQK